MESSADKSSAYESFQGGEDAPSQDRPNRSSLRQIQTNPFASIDTIDDESLLTFKDLAEEEERLSSVVNSSTVKDESKNRYESYCEVRHSCHARWFVDGRDYFEHLADMLEKAKSEIFITDWSINPEVFLKRGPNATSNDRLDRILQRKAREGVMIYVLIWYETSSAMAGTVNSSHATEVLEGLHHNIRVIRHPNGKMKVYWTHHQKTVVIDQCRAYVGGIDLCFGRYDTPKHALIDDCYISSSFPGKDYYNPLFKDFMDLHLPFVDIIDRQTVPRLPWHDIHSYVDRDAARDIGKNFIERWNHHLTKKLNSGDSRVKLYPKLQIASQPYLISDFPNGSVTCQIIRSLGQWSGGLSVKERSIQNAYKELIDTAEHFIYVENQYFISVENSLTEALFQRISTAIRLNQVFRVIIVIPVHPCGDWKVPSIKYVMKWQYDTISRGGSSLLERLAADFPGVLISDYISFYSLRTAAELNGNLVCDQIYIHSKLLIVDDRRVIIGSANWNDRSMLGDRDSEIAMVIEDNRYIPTKMNGTFYLASKFAHSLRKNLFMEHLGLSEDESEIVEDPISSDCYTNLWAATATVNQSAFSQLFPTLPSDSLNNLAKLAEVENISDTKSDSERRRIYSMIKGHLVIFPVNFMKDEKLDSGATIEKILPFKVFQ